MLQQIENSFTRWLRNNQQMLLELAVADIDGNNALHMAVRSKESNRSLKDGKIGRTQLTALLNMARTQPAHIIKHFVSERMTRRRKLGKDHEEAYWQALLNNLKKLDSIVADALASCGINDPDAAFLSLAKSKIMGTYLEHFVAHCRYQTQFTVDEVIE